MKTWFGLFLIASVILVLALRGVFGAYPDEWEWVGVVLASVGIAMAIPGLLQVILGRPELVLEAETHARGSDRSLIIFVKNPPTTHLVKNLGVKRDTIQSLTAHFQIREAGSGQILVPILHARLYSDSDESDRGSQRISLPPTYSVAASLMVATWDSTGGHAIVVPDRLRPELALPRGYFELELILTIDGEPIKYRGKFLVGEGPDDLRWSPGTLERVT